MGGSRGRPGRSAVLLTPWIQAYLMFDLCASESAVVRDVIPYYQRDEPRPAYHARTPFRAARVAVPRRPRPRRRVWDRRALPPERGVWASKAQKHHFRSGLPRDRRLDQSVASVVTRRKSNTTSAAGSLNSVGRAFPVQRVSSHVPTTQQSFSLSPSSS